MDEIKVGEKYFTLGINLKLFGVIQSAMFKVQVIKVVNDRNCLVQVKHYKTKECNKVIIMISKKMLMDNNSSFKID